MKKVFKVFRNDLKSIIKNPVALFIITGLCILPSLYAWINIKACWDPYANTGNLPVAVVNNDEGAIFNGKSINVGNEVVDSLKKNKNIGWIFEDEWQANSGLNEGKYYAMIEIPANFSKGLISLASTNPQKPNIIYKANEKANAIATKITNAAKESVAREIKVNFVDTVNEKAFEKLNTVGGELETHKPEILQLNDILNSSIGELEKVKNHINKANENSASLQKYLKTVQNDIPTLTNQINTLQKATNESKNLMMATQQTVNSLGGNINSDIMQIQSSNKKVQDLINELKKLNNTSGDLTQIIKDTEGIDRLLGTMDNLIDSRIKILEALNDLKNSKGIFKFIDSLKKLDKAIKDAKNISSNISSSAKSGTATKEHIDEMLNILSTTSNGISDLVSASSDSLYSGLIPTLNSIGDGITTGLNNADEVLDSIKVIVPQLNALAKFGVATSEVAIDEGNRINDKLTTFQGDLNKLTDKTKDLTEENLNEILDMMEKNPDEMASFISSPIKVIEKEVYDAGIFGVGLTPFYTVLAIWVGALLSSALLSVECEEEFKEKEKINLWQEHFGKMLLFLSIVIIQAIIVTLGDVYILGVNAADKKLMLNLAVLTAVAFTIIIYTLVSMFGNVGKAVAVIIMVFQIAGAGGIYPIQTNPEIFGRLQFLWPFTYAINGFREAIAGPIWESVNKNLYALCIFAVGFLVLVILKAPIRKLSYYMDNKFRESGL
ncbi:YhgE/Pip domain-containing protein [Clostridium lundense]|uniref:YhgE/Pip domain-containing protein n=1 Tax=Clostridium lundense TaxID=319475 RepID=UPI000482A99C|nr:YhgE/Pip domain-containing protein [Clostridium lundense]